MKILLAPSETKISGGQYSNMNKIFFYSEEIIQSYDNYVKNTSIEKLMEFFNIKNKDECKHYIKGINQKTTEAIKRYSGTAFKAIDYKNLNINAKKYINENVMIFSNLFGILRADDLIPNYKIKQGKKLPNLDIVKFYKKHLEERLDNYFNDTIVDLSANYYKKFYTPKVPVVNFKFLKNGKIVNHWSKYYKGKILKKMAEENIKNTSDLMQTKFENLSIVETKTDKNIKTIIMDII